MGIMGRLGQKCRRWAWPIAKSIALGWAALLTLTYLVEQPLLRLTAPLVGLHWIATASLFAKGLTLAASGWAAGRLNRAAQLWGVLAFAATLAIFSFDFLLPLDVPGLLRLAADALEDTRYLGTLATIVGQHVFLFGSLIAGGLLSQPRQAPLSILGETPP